MRGADANKNDRTVGRTADFSLKGDPMLALNILIVEDDDGDDGKQANAPRGEGREFAHPRGGRGRGAGRHARRVRRYRQITFVHIVRRYRPAEHERAAAPPGSARRSGTREIARLNSGDIQER